jgi:cell division protein FtsB
VIKRNKQWKKMRKQYKNIKRRNTQKEAEVD